MHAAMTRLFPAAPSNDDDGEDADAGYSAFCLVKVGGVVKDTRLITQIMPGTVDIEFDDKLVFDNVPPDFRCILEFYAYPRSSNTSSRNHSVFSSLKKASVLDPVRRASEQIDAPNSGGATNGAIGSTGEAYFELLCRCELTRAELENRVRSHSLQASASSVDSDLPLFGSLCLRLVAQPESTFRPIISGLLWIRKLTASPVQSAARQYHCELFNRRLSAYLVETNSAADVDSASDGVQMRASSGKKNKNFRKADLVLAVVPQTTFLDEAPVDRLVELLVPGRFSSMTSLHLNNTSTTDQSSLTQFTPDQSLNRTESEPDLFSPQRRDLLSPQRKELLRRATSSPLACASPDSWFSVSVPRALPVRKVQSVADLADEPAVQPVVKHAVRLSSVRLATAQWDEAAATEEVNDYEEVYELACQGRGVSQWLAMMRFHVREQEIWGADAFSETLNVPREMSSLCDRSVRCSTRLPSNWYQPVRALPLTTLIE